MDAVAGPDREAEAFTLEHLQRVAELTQATTTEPTGRRGPARQRKRRQREQAVRRAVVDFWDWAVEQGDQTTTVADRLQMSPRTLRYWRQHQAEPLQVVPLGRPTARSGRDQRQAVVDYVAAVGPGLSLAALRAQFPALARAELDELLRRCRQVWRQRYQVTANVLKWTTPGTVWAIDFTEPPAPIDGVYPWLLAVRDLASGYQLLWKPLWDATGATTAQVLAELFAVCGAPLVLKSDNGSAFGSEAVQVVLAQSGVCPLFSPPRCPRYNGAIEASIGWMKQRTAWQALGGGHPGDWTSADVIGAWEVANAMSRDRGWRGPTRAEVWAGRSPLKAATREIFQATVADERRLERLTQGLSIEEALGIMEGRGVDRKALTRALVAHDYLVFRRRRIPAPFPGRTTARDS